MGFCRRCGEIVAEARCKCGGTAVAAVVPWNQSNSKQKTQDRWSKTYVSSDRSPTRSLSKEPSTQINVHDTGSTITANVPPSPTKRFPRPAKTNSFSSPIPVFGNRVSAHITTATSQFNRPSSPLKHSTTVPAPESDILPSPSPHTSTLTKVYGSVLQPKESLMTHSCAICLSPFPPDATIYPDPSMQSPNASRFLCKTCFTTNGGSKGTCPTCSRPVLALKAEGGFVQTAGKFWHKRCFNCAACFKNIGDFPLVDLLGRPSCAECFDECLKRETTPKKRWSSGGNSPLVDQKNNIGGMTLNSSKRSKSREGSPALEELEQRLGIVKSREGSPALEEEVSQKLSLAGSPARISRVSGYPAAGISPTAAHECLNASQESSHRSHEKLNTRLEGSPVRRHEHIKNQEVDREGISARPRYTSESPSPDYISATRSPNPGAAIEERKMRFFKRSSSPSSAFSKSAPSSTQDTTPPHSPSPSLVYLPKLPFSTSNADTSIYPALTIPGTPDLMSDSSDTTTQSSGPDSPPRDEMGADIDVFTVSKVFGRGYGSRYTRREFFDGPGDNGTIMEESASQMETPTPPHKSTGSMNAELACTPTKIQSQQKLIKSPIPKSLVLTIPVSSPELSSTCAKCHGALLASHQGERLVTVPADPGSVEEKPKTYHADCFRCVICEGLFKEGGTGQAAFVKVEKGACHIECAAAEAAKVGTSPSHPTSVPTSVSASSPMLASTSVYTSSRLERSPLTAPPTSTPASFPRFGSMSACPGCRKSVSPMERGVVPGPQGSRWHAACLVCGGKKEAVKGWGRGKEERKNGEPGCGKKLDSAAKGDGEGGVWCRECSLLLPMGMRGSPQGSPTRSPIVPAYTGSVGKIGKVVPQFTGTTTLARQFTGFGGGDAALLRQLSGGGLSPTRQLGMMSGGSGVKQRPRSVVGMRHTKSVDEGRGMFLVRQMTGAGAGSGVSGE